MPQPKKTRSGRAQYSEEQKALVLAKYNLCFNSDDRIVLAKEAEVESLQKLYNLSSRLGATRPHSSSSDEWTSDAPDGYDVTQDFSRLYLRDSFKDTKWSQKEDDFIQEHFGKSFIEEIAFFLNKSETATAYRSRQLGLRNIPKYWSAAKVAPWLGIGLKDLLLLSKNGLEIFPCTDRDGEVKIVLISTVSLARILLRGRLYRKLLNPAKYNADEFFIRDVVESVVALQKEEAVWEPNAWVSHGHTCLNPFADLSFGWFYDGQDKAMEGLEDLDPRDLSIKADVTSDNWLRGENGQDDSSEKLKEVAVDLGKFNKELAG
jgi:hypothetical protein